MADWSFQLYSARNFPPLAQTLQLLAKTGYRQVEGYGGLYPQLDELQQALQASGLTMPTGHFGWDMLKNHFADAVHIARTLGMHTVICPYLLPDARPTDSEGWLAFAAELEQVAQQLKQEGFGFAWHNHDFELKALPDGGIPMALLLEGAPGMQWEVDVAWVVRGGANPLHWISEYGGRICAAHLKDIAAVGECREEDGWADLGHGVMDWSTLWRALQATPARVFVMEHDNPSDLARFAARSLSTAHAL
ncbi:sugar phosphate isomerase/epimerase [Pokkaliibacter sp. MBI-7]|uniref:sugar phosphate isomerase/epimerase family protein n=1 Tax=Pokkaliibacter sp. MBI-7 TaxID=3040600 RepID=UPI002446BB12|nr:sugar phosphate isomerase/epimerase [Pokkaliibacter sp. MBI-7]MDH2436261.1 sugar phosphate isomerase/epimerase [Pokkaliibacter sp. MBI-7]